MQLLHANLYALSIHCIAIGRKLKAEEPTHTHTKKQIVKEMVEATAEKRNENIETVTENFKVLNAMQCC